MSAEQWALQALSKYAVDSWEYDTVVYQLVAFLDAAYGVIGSNVTRKVRLARIQEARDRLQVALADIDAGKEPTS